jgi:glutathione peroxidase-family protein
VEHQGRRGAAARLFGLALSRHRHARGGPACRLELKASPNGGQSDITWNFEKFLIGREGQVLKRYSPRITPEELGADIERALD